MKNDRKCPSCGSTCLEPGAIQSTGKVYFRPENTSFFTLNTADVPIEASLCMDCGYVMMIGDLRKANKILKQAKAH